MSSLNFAVRAPIMCSGTHTKCWTAYSRWSTRNNSFLHISFTQTLLLCSCVYRHRLVIPLFFSRTAYTHWFLAWQIVLYNYLPTYSYVVRLLSAILWLRLVVVGIHNISLVLYISLFWLPGAYIEDRPCDIGNGEQIPGSVAVPFLAQHCGTGNKMTLDCFEMPPAVTMDMYLCTQCCASK